MIKPRINKIYPKIKNGFTLIETLVVITIFAILAVLVTLTISASLQSSKKSEASSRVRSELEYAVGIMERQLRNADLIVDCNNAATPYLIKYKDRDGVSAQFILINDDEAIARIASQSGQLMQGPYLTSDKIKVTEAAFTCTKDENNPNVPESIDISLSAVSQEEGITAGRASIDTKVILRNY